MSFVDSRPIFGRALVGGFIAGLVLLIVEFALMAAVGGSLTLDPLRSIGTAVLDQVTLPPDLDIAYLPTIAGLVVFLIVAMFLGVVYGLIFGRREFPLPVGLLVGIVYGFLVYAIVHIGLGQLIPWLAEGLNWIVIVPYFAFGAVLGIWLARQPGVVAYA